MEIVNFFEKLAGKWFSQRTTHDIASKQSQAGKSDLQIDFLPADSADVQQLCQAAAAAAPALCGLRLSQSSTIEGDPKTLTGTTLMVPLSPAADGSGSILYGTPSSSSMRQYRLEDGVLTILAEDDQARSEERLWFVNDNVRMRTQVLERPDGLRLTSFCSEIRLGAKPPASSATG
ncbi:phycobiliprotein lyase [Romeria aff. gracilis LEGE 07310]|uniref:Chromophore lyase CpcS/CpeS n=1 Tax=Vasconcelosia minhoensis LEGE 07310 TaxID=915328 RepID=A0A8J7DRB8_9CYAN|nr:phycobiliprotein lyase [Romeria gracilis]MBE9078184.1 phycobiliprotein lyase [Romeria aff. gracilis LEGE 07310]